MSAALILAVTAGGARAAEPLRLGFLSAQSGPFSSIGGEQKRGLEVALAELGGMVGGRKVEIIAADSRSNASAAVQEVDRLVFREQVDLITGVTASNEVAAVVGPITEARKFFLGTNGGPNNFAGKDCSPYYFSVAFLNGQANDGLGRYMADGKLSKLFLMGMDYQAGWDHVGAVRDQFTRDVPGGAIAGQVFTPQALFDFSNEFAKIRASGADAVFAFYPGGAAVTFVKQWAQSGLQGKVRLFSNMGLTDPAQAQAQGDGIFGTIIASPYMPSLENPANQAFVKAFHARFGRDPSIYAAQQYDAIRLLDAALKETGGSLADDALRTAIGHAAFVSVRGKFGFFRNHMPVQDNHLFEVTKGADGQAYFKHLSSIAGAPDPALAAECPMK